MSLLIYGLNFINLIDTTSCVFLILVWATRERAEKRILFPRIKEGIKEGFSQLKSNTKYRDFVSQ